MSNFKSLASQELLLLLHVSIAYSKEAKRTFLTPVSIWHLWVWLGQVSVDPQELSCQISSL